MGGYGSGRQDGRPLVDASLWIDIALMIRTGRAVPGTCVSGKLSWACKEKQVGSISYRADMVDPDNSWLILIYRRRADDGMEAVTQSVRLAFTVPPYGGRRWWMLCPKQGHRVGKLHMPAGGDGFASRRALRLGYRSQRLAPNDKPLERLFALQMKLGGAPGWDQPLHRPKGMWRRTYERHLRRYYELDRASLVAASAGLSDGFLEWVRAEQFATARNRSA